MIRRIHQRFQRSSLLKFILTGGINTAIDASVFVLLRSLGLSVVTANIVSTSAALIIGYILNSRYTFSSLALSKKRLAAYFIVTLIGLWLIQPIVITAMIQLHASVAYSQPLARIVGHEIVLLNIIPKLTATVVTMVWNYLWYKKVIFARIEPAPPVRPSMSASSHLGD